MERPDIGINDIKDCKWLLQGYDDTKPKLKSCYNWLKDSRWYLTTNQFGRVEILSSCHRQTIIKYLTLFTEPLAYYRLRLLSWSHLSKSFTLFYCCLSYFTSYWTSFICWRKTLVYLGLKRKAKMEKKIKKYWIKPASYKSNEECRFKNHPTIDLIVTYQTNSSLLYFC